MTAELALALPTLVIVLVIGIWLQSAVALRAQALDAARAGARAAARGDADALVRSSIGAALPPGASVVIAHSGQRVVVTVTTRVTPPAGLAALIGAQTLTASATGATEAGAP